ncbi:MAG: hypothetical protein AB8D52_02930 [Gammaproteobacteria bacterium]
MFIFRSIPLFVFLWAAYYVLTMVSGVAAVETILFSKILPSGVEWNITNGDAFIFAGIIFLYIEIFKATRTTSGSILDHTLSMIVFVGMLLHFILGEQTGNSVFAAMTLMALVDVVAGFTVTIISARRDFGFGGNNPDV